MHVCVSGNPLKYIKIEVINPFSENPLNIPPLMLNRTKTFMQWRGERQRESERKRAVPCVPQVHTQNNNNNANSSYNNNNNDEKFLLRSTMKRDTKIIIL